MEFLANMMGYGMAALTTLKIINISYRVYPYFMKTHRQLTQTNHSKYFLVTGATDGIGKQYAKHLINLGHNVIISGRNQNKITNVIKELSQYTQIKGNTCKQLHIDFGKTNHMEFCQKIGELGIDEHSIIGIINCCGIASLNPVADHPYEDNTGKNMGMIPSVKEIQKVNIFPLEMMLGLGSRSDTFLSKYIHRSQSQTDIYPLLIHISSLTARYPLPYSAHYSATKAYTSALLSAYKREKQMDRKIKNVLNVEPWYVSTKMIGNKKSIDSVTPEEVVKGSLKCLIHKDRCTGSIKHQMIDEVYSILDQMKLPFGLNKRIMGKLIDEKAEDKYVRLKKIIAAKTSRLKRKNSRQ